MYTGSLDKTIRVSGLVHLFQLIQNYITIGNVLRLLLNNQEVVISSLFLGLPTYPKLFGSLCFFFGVISFVSWYDAVIPF